MATIAFSMLKFTGGLKTFPAAGLDPWSYFYFVAGEGGGVVLLVDIGGLISGVSGFRVAYKFCISVPELQIPVAFNLEPTGYKFNRLQVHLPTTEPNKPKLTFTASRSKIPILKCICYYCPKIPIFKCMCYYVLFLYGSQISAAFSL